jgi:hypothetical protein
VAELVEFTHSQLLQLAETAAVEMARLQIPLQRLELQILAAVAVAEWSIRRTDPERLVGRAL